ncbi:MAG TPA: hypothetical protein VK961_02360 [Chthoniobacter sp.]|nr:hypothetical protein [Chthoniobacter sp.]
MMLTTALAGVCLLAGGFWQWRQHFAQPSSRSVRLDLPVQVEPILPREDVLATYENTFRCTIYYSPRESGITKQGGFNVALETRPGLGNHKYAVDFLRAVQAEGFGRLKEPVDGKAYIRYWSKEWGFIEQPVDNRQRPLVARQSCAIAKPFALVKPAMMVRIRCAQAPDHFNNLLWQVNDTGSGLEDRQLDLYWGEDDPLGPGKKLCRPKGLDCELVNPTIMVIAQQRR